MGIELTRIHYENLDARQKENYNFQKISAVLADFGFVSVRLSDDWQGADFIAQHIDGETFLKVQLKSRLAFNRKYKGKNLCVAFPHKGSWYLYRHDALLEIALRNTQIGSSRSWKKNGSYHFPRLTKPLMEKLILKKFRIANLHDLR